MYDGDYEFQTIKGGNLYKLKYIVSEIYILSIRFHKIFFVCEYKLRGLFLKTNDATTC
jgi:hypothetical protein